MQTSARLIDIVHPSTGRVERIPQTFFSLNEAEQTRYQEFCTAHLGLVAEKKELIKRAPEERMAREQSVQELFLEFIGPHLQASGLAAARSFTDYDEKKKTHLVTPSYRLFKDNQPFDLALGVTYWFSPLNQPLSCTTHLDFYGILNLPSRELVYDLLRKVVQEREQDGVNFPLVEIGSFIFFAPAEFALPLMGFVRDILSRIGPENIEDLTVLQMQREYVPHLGDTGSRRDAVLRETFHEAYEKRLEQELLKAGVISLSGLEQVSLDSIFNPERVIH